jgi:hypothetical protein
MRTVPTAVLLAPLLLILSCHEGDTVIVNSDCGLVRSDLVGTYTFTLPAASSQLFNCSDPTFNNKDVTLAVTSTLSFNDMEVFASENNVGFFFRNSSSPADVYGNVETDSCGMLFGLMINASATDPTPLYLQCIGTLDRHTGFLGAACDSATVLKSPLTDPVGIASDCDLSRILQVSVSIH